MKRFKKDERVRLLEAQTLEADGFEAEPGALGTVVGYSVAGKGLYLVAWDHI